MPSVLHTRSNRPAQSSSQEEPLILERLREKYEFGTLERIADEGTEFRRLKEVAKEHTNALNRQSTQLKNSIKKVLQKENLGPEDWIHYDDTGYKFDVASSERLPVEAIFNLYETKKITKEQFLKCISVSKSEASRVIGSFIVEKLVETTPGKTADVRTKELTEKEKTKVPLIVRKKPELANVIIKPRPITGKTIKPGQSLKPLRIIRKKSW